MILVQIDGIHERLNNLLLIVRVIDVSVLELADPVHDLLFGVFWPRQLRLCDVDRQLFPLFFQLLQSLLGGGGQNTGLNRIHQIGDALFTFLELCFQRRNGRVLLILQ